MPDEPENAITPADLTKMVVTSGATAIAAFTGDPALQGLTVIGAGIFVLANKHLFSKLEKWKHSLDQGFGVLVKTKGFDFDSLNEKEKDRIVTIVSKATIIAMQDLREEKRQYLYNAVINSVYDKGDVNIQLMRMHLIDILNGWHIEMLKAFDPPREPAFEKLTVWRMFSDLKKELPSIPRTVSRQIFDALVTNGLILRVGSEDSSDPIEQAHITELGKEFLKFISTPRPISEQ